jgi:hypothetical protein
VVADNRRRNGQHDFLSLTRVATARGSSAMRSKDRSRSIHSCQGDSARTADWRGVPDEIRKYVETETGGDYAVTTALRCRDSRTPLSPTFPSISHVRGDLISPQPLPIVPDLSRSLAAC